jgi:ectoine hydroxylase-related dioxygenase (phytanoyl-CoA dioxygenase family)
MTSDRLREIYDRDGYLTGIDVFSSAEIAAYGESFDHLEARVGRDTAQIGLTNRHFEEEFIWRLASDERVLDVIESVIGPNVMLGATHIFCKHPDPKADQFVAWHQDVTYWGLTPPVAHTAWIAIDDSDLENGCMLVMPGSHTEGLLEHGKSAHEGNLLSVNQEVSAALFEEGKSEPLELKAGQISVHHGALLHASQPNLSNRRRCGLTVRFVDPSVKQKRPNSKAGVWRGILVRGEDNYGHYPATARPF